jgi:hypothetical protein
MSLNISLNDCRPLSITAANCQPLTVTAADCQPLSLETRVTTAVTRTRSLPSEKAAYSTWLNERFDELKTSLNKANQALRDGKLSDWLISSEAANRAHSTIKNAFAQHMNLLSGDDNLRWQNQLSPAVDKQKLYLAVLGDLGSMVLPGSDGSEQDISLQMKFIWELDTTTNDLNGDMTNEEKWKALQSYIKTCQSLRDAIQASDKISSERKASLLGNHAFSTNFATAVAEFEEQKRAVCELRKGMTSLNKQCFEAVGKLLSKDLLTFRNLSGDIDSAWESLQTTLADLKTTDRNTYDAHVSSKEYNLLFNEYSNWFEPASNLSESLVIPENQVPQEKYKAQMEYICGLLQLNHYLISAKNRQPTDPEMSKDMEQIDAWSNTVNALHQLPANKGFFAAIFKTSAFAKIQKRVRTRTTSAAPAANQQQAAPAAATTSAAATVAAAASAAPAAPAAADAPMKVTPVISAVGAAPAAATTIAAAAGVLSANQPAAPSAATQKLVVQTEGERLFPSDTAKAKIADRILGLAGVARFGFEELVKASDAAFKAGYNGPMNTYGSLRKQLGSADFDRLSAVDKNKIRTAATVVALSEMAAAAEERFTRLNAASTAPASAAASSPAPVSLASSVGSTLSNVLNWMTAE